jgi:hypothetical protein
MPGVRFRALKGAGIRYGHKQDESSIVTGDQSEKSRWYRAYSSTLGNRGALVFLNNSPETQKGEYP